MATERPIKFPIRYSKVREFEISEDGCISETEKIIMPNGTIKILSSSGGLASGELLEAYLIFSNLK